MGCNWRRAPCGSLLYFIASVILSFARTPYNREFTAAITQEASNTLASAAFLLSPKSPLLLPLFSLLFVAGSFAAAEDFVCALNRAKWTFLFIFLILHGGLVSQSGYIITEWPSGGYCAEKNRLIVAEPDSSRIYFFSPPKRTGLYFFSVKVRREDEAWIGPKRPKRDRCRWLARWR